MDIVFMRPRYSSGGQFIIEPSASLDTLHYGLGSTSATITFIADAAGVTTWNNLYSYTISSDNLIVDLSGYDSSNGDTLVLVDYEAGQLSGAFTSVTLVGDFLATIDYVYDQGGGDLAIALTNITPPDTTPPVITLLGNNPVDIDQGTSFTDPGATASDDHDGNVTSSIVISGSVDANTIGSYTLSYNVSDAAGNTATAATRTVNVIDVTPPLITLLGENPMELLQGTVYTDPGATAIDNHDGDITASMVVSGSVDTGTVGYYAQGYDVSDAAGNAAVTVSRTVNVTDILTWDDGSGDDNWSSAANWNLDHVPANGLSVVLTATDQSFMDIDWTIGSGQSLTSTASGFDDDLRISGGDLTLATGGSIDVGFLRSTSAGSDILIYSGATFEADNLNGVTGSFIDFTANATGVTTVQVNDTLNINGSDLIVDLTNYDTANGTTLVLFEYGTLANTFTSVILTEGWTGSIDYAYDLGGGDLAVAITGLTEPVDPIAWDDGAGNDYWSSAANWDGNVAPVNGDTVELGDTGDIRLNSAFTIESGRSLTATGTGYNPELILEGSSAVLTLATGGAMDVAFFRPRYTAGGQFIIEANASLNTDIFHATVANSKLRLDVATTVF